VDKINKWHTFPVLCNLAPTPGLSHIAFIVVKWCEKLRNNAKDATFVAWFVKRTMEQSTAVNC